MACLILFLFLSSFALPGAIGTTSDQIVINEFDLNPPGNDNNGSVEEWVELYNPTSEAVDIGGWTLSTTSGATVSVTIPGGTVIGANGYYVHRRGSQWLDNDGESVILRDASGKQIDGTPARSDDDNNERSWSRYPNGQDTDSATDWRFFFCGLWASMCSWGDAPPFERGGTRSRPFVPESPWRSSDFSSCRPPSSAPSRSGR